MTPWTGEKPKPGARVFIEKYAGRQVTGRDGRVYRLMDYLAVGAVYEADVGDGIALTSMEHPPGLIDKMADAIRSGKLSLNQNGARKSGDN